LKQDVLEAQALGEANNEEAKAQIKEEHEASRKELEARL
jgi:hypothetical protein